MRRNKVMFCWAWPDSVHLIGFKREKTLTLINLLNPLEHEEGGGELGVSGFHSPIRWATSVVCTEHGPLKCTLTFIRISLTPIMGEPARREEENSVSSDHSHLKLLLDL